VSTFDDPHASAGDPGVDVDLSEPRRVHVVGIGGAAMNAIASVLVSMGHEVSGSDQAESPALDRLRARGVAVHVGHDAANIDDGTDVVTVSTAIPLVNPELQAARTRGLPVISRGRMMAAIAARRRTVAVAGTHGKTTTSSMLAAILIEAGRDPSFIIGGDVNGGSGAAWADGDLFVVEADESDGMFLELPRHGAIVTNLEPDHLEHYGDFAGLRVAFEAFLADTPGPTVVSADDPEAAALGASVGARTFGTSPDADYRMVDLDRSRAGVAFSVVRVGKVVADVVVPLSGLHNARNACAALVMAIELGVPATDAVRALAAFGGVARRYEHRGETNGVVFIDDYAHLPTEVAAAVEATGDGAWNRVVCVFQPHRYSRTAALWPEFADAFEGVDVLAVTDVYTAGEAPRPGVSGKLIVDAVLDAHPWHRVAYLPHRSDAETFLVHELRPGDICLTLGAGDLTALPDEVQARLRAG
jgi:UDP-N-acetylmuramate--alanine ligase